MIANRLVRGALPALGQPKTPATIPHSHRSYPPVLARMWHGSAGSAPDPSDLHAYRYLPISLPTCRDRCKIAAMTTSPPGVQVPKPKKKWWRLTTPRATVIAALIGVAGGYLIAHTTGTAAETPSSPPPPHVHITDVTWVPHGQGRYEVKGVAQNLAAGQVLWTFNQPISQNKALTI
jgi:hypothetical protein